MNNVNDMEQIDLKRMLEIVLERIVSIIVITLIFGLASFGISKFIPPKYESYITMYINNQRSSVSSTINGDTKTLSSDIAASQQLVPTYIEMIKSNNVLQAVLDKFSRKTGEEISVAAFKKMIDASALSNTEILKVTVKSEDAAVASELANTIASVAPEKIQGFIEKSEVRIVDSAKTSTVPVSPNVRNNTILGALLGLVFSISFILLKELFDVRVKSVDDLVQRFPYPVLGSIPEIYVAYDESATAVGDNKNKKGKE